MIDHASDSDVLRTLSLDEMIELKTCLVEMYLDIAHVCERNGLCLMLGGGSTLGSVRHKGFIPWDDDLDLLMPRKDYNKFAELFEKELSDKYILVAPNRSAPAKTRFPKIIKKGTTFRELTDLYSEFYCGVFLDIFILENVPKNIIHRTLKGVLCSGLMYMGAQAYWYEHQGEAIRRHMLRTVEGTKAYKKKRIIGRLCAVIPSYRWYNMIDSAVQHKHETGLMGIPTGRKHYFGEILPTFVYLPVSEGIFENHTVKLPHNCDAYLRNLYGNYMEIPPVEKRERHLIVDFSLEREGSTII